jgi:PAS domain S-box-containing protein
MFGYGLTDDIPVNPSAFTHPDDLPRVLSELTVMLHNPDYKPTLIYRFADAKGNWLWVESTFSNMLNNPNVESIVINFRNITDRKLAEEEVLRLNAGLEERVKERTAQLEAANSELQAFAYSVSHDLRAPLRAIDGFSKFVLEDYGTKLDQEGQRLLGLIRANTQKMDKLITDILSLSRVSRSEHKKSGIDMTKMALSMYNEVASPETQQKIEFIIDPLPGIFADPTFIKQVWINLLSNAIKFSSLSSGPEIKIGGYNDGKSNVYYVRDNGVGFNPEYSHKLFGVFQRLHKATEFEGTGVGLAIVQRIILRHGGKVWAESREGYGATFYFSLPVTDVM